MNRRLVESVKRSPLSPYAAAIVFFTTAAVFWFHGIVFHPQHELLRGIADGTSQLRDYWAANHVHRTPFTFARDPLNGAPEGRPLTTAIQVGQAYQPGFVTVGGSVIGLIAAWNLLIVVGFVATSSATFALLRSIGCTFTASLFGGYAFGFSPWAFERASAGAPAFDNAWIFPLCIAALFFARRRTWRSVIPGGVAFAGAFYVASYFGLLACLLAGLYWLVEIVRLRSRSELLRTSALLALQFGVALLCYAPALAVYLKNTQAVSQQISNPSRQLQNLGASVREYFLPYGHHPILGTITQHVPGSGNFPEATLFYGYSTMLLASIAFVLLVKRNRWLVENRYRLAIARFAVILTPAAFAFSLKSHIHIVGTTVPTPSAFTSHITTLWRVYARFGVLFGLAIAVLAALALSAIRWRSATIVSVAALAILVGFEYLPGHIATFSATARPAYVVWLQDHPGGIVASYPAPTDQPEALSLAQQEYWYQHFHAHPLYTYFGSGTGGTREDGIRILSRYLNDPETPGILADEHVRYVVVHDDVYAEEHMQPPGVPSGMSLVATFKGQRILELQNGIPPVDLNAALEQNAPEVASVQGLQAPSLSFGNGFGESIAGLRTATAVAEVTVVNHDPRLKRMRLNIAAQSHGAQVDVDITVSPSGLTQSIQLPPNRTFITLNPFPIGKTATVTFTTRGVPSGKPAIGFWSVEAQPLADYSVSLAG